ncbi:Helix-turn-helix family protein [Candidatus Desulfosporosinus infrequens]|uniref:Helix-turn-helix family protein n=1 Tax=Candidatus Desulfosporosinus infrequens TaxID=2043169 RepID=A0A2U3LHK6_9FIRM|nr:Helix-turn-helix family protein [Candidatus Desulfosporosinus infrequens]
MNRLKDVMFSKKVNQERLKELTGIDQSELSKIINDKRLGMQLKTAQKIAHALDSTVEEIWPYGWWLG